MNKCVERIYNGIIKENPTFVLMLGMCPTLATTTSAINGLGMGLSTTAVLMFSNMLISALRNIIPDRVRIPAFIVVVASLVTIVQLLILYTVILASSEGIIVCIVGFGINSGAYLAEVARSGIASVDPGQMEAGRSLGLGYGVTMRKIVLPQAVKNILPALFNEFIALLKETSVAGYIAVRDLTKASDGIRGITFNSVPLYLAAIIYLVFVIGITQIQKQVERRLAQSDRG